MQQHKKALLERTLTAAELASSEARAAEVRLRHGGPAVPERRVAAEKLADDHDAFVATGRREELPRER